jgi:hypothetical protein
MASVISPIITAGLSELQTVLISNQRAISNIFLDVSIEERHDDQLTITCVWQVFSAHFGSLIWPTLSD